VSDLIERLERAVEFIDTDEDQRIADLCDEAVHEILRLRNRVKELEKRHTIIEEFPQDRQKIDDAYDRAREAWLRWRARCD
jgi:hypothetical protein